MKIERLTPSLEALDELFGFDAVCSFLTEDERPFSGALGYLDWRLCGALSRVVQTGFFKALPGERLLLPTDWRIPAHKVFVLGLGRVATVTELGLEHALSSAALMLGKAGVESVALTLPHLPKGLDGGLVTSLERAFLNGFKGRVALFEA